VPKAADSRLRTPYSILKSKEKLLGASTNASPRFFHHFGLSDWLSLLRADMHIIVAVGWSFESTRSVESRVNH
jgi:hypothetical protein